MNNNLGFQNEWNFFYYLNGKKVSEVNQLFKQFIYDNFSNVSSDMKISSYVNLNRKKEDIWIRIGREKKSISIKMGKSATVHNESIYTFIEFLKDEKVPKKIINIILEYFFADGTYDGSGERKLTFPQYKLKMKRKIKKANKYFIKNEELLKKIIRRFVLGSVDILICGSIDDFVYITKEEIIKVLLSLKNEPSTTIHFSKLLFSVRSRRNDVDKFIVQIKWYTLYEDIIRVRGYSK